jgi:hypothetical protein
MPVKVGSILYAEVQDGRGIAFVKIIEETPKTYKACYFTTRENPDKSLIPWHGSPVCELLRKDPFGVVIAVSGKDRKWNLWNGEPVFRKKPK